MFCKKGIIRNFTKFTEKILAQFFPVNVVKLLRTPFCIFPKGNKLISSMVCSIHGHVSYILEANSKRRIRKKEKK